MANRRMVSNRIVNSAKFLKMPLETQALYFHLVLRADDDGVVEAYPLMRLLGTAPNNFDILKAKGLIEQLNEDQVVIVTDWLEHNSIRADRKIDSIYKPLLDRAQIKTLEPKPRSDVKDNTKRIGGQSTDGIGKDRLGKVSKEEREPSSFKKKGEEKPYYDGQEMRLVKGKWFVLPRDGGHPWLEFVGKESDIEYK